MTDRAWDRLDQNIQLLLYLFHLRGDFQYEAAQISASDFAGMNPSSPNEAAGAYPGKESNVPLSQGNFQHFFLHFGCSEDCSGTSVKLVRIGL